MNTITYTQKKRQKSNQGFTLVESLVSILILLLVVVGPMTIAAKGLQNSYFASEQITAVFLAQEAMESIQKLRLDSALEVSTNGGTGSTWDWFNSDIDASCKTADGCDVNMIDPANVSFVDCPAGGCRLKTRPDSSSANIEYGDVPSWTDDSIYTRSIVVTDEGGDQASVTVTVKWNTNLFSGPREVVLQGWIFNQYDLLENP